MRGWRAMPRPANRSGGHFVRLQAAGVYHRGQLDRPLDARRISPRADTVAATLALVQRLVGHLPDDGRLPLFVFRAGYNPIALGAGLADTRAGVLVRIRAGSSIPTPPRHPRHGRPA